jgi:hypothetical protein
MFLNVRAAKAWHIRTMLSAEFPDTNAENILIHQGETLLRRGSTAAWVTHWV